MGDVVSILRIRDELTALQDEPPKINIQPAKELITEELAAEHTCEPIKDLRDIYRISDFFITNGKYRDNMLFICGINFGLRIGDLLSLRFSKIINNDGTFKEAFSILEQKTKNTRNIQRNRHITINAAVAEAVEAYLSNTDGVSLSDYMFTGIGNRSKNSGKPISRKTVDRILKETCHELGVDVHAATHTLRKTFAYHQLRMSNNDPRKLLLLQQMFGHASQLVTLRYAGITTEEISEAYKDLNLGIRNAGHRVVDITEVA